MIWRGAQAPPNVQRLGKQTKSFGKQKSEATPANKASVGDIKSKRRALQINRAAVRCRSQVLDNFYIGFYRANYPSVKGKEARLFADSYGVKRAEKMGRNAANTSRAFQPQQRDVGTQRIDPTTGRVTTQSQRRAASIRHAQQTSSGPTITLTKQKRDTIQKPNVTSESNDPYNTAVEAYDPAKDEFLKNRPPAPKCNAKPGVRCIREKWGAIRPLPVLLVKTPLVPQTVS